MERQRLGQQKSSYYSVASNLSHQHRQAFREKKLVQELVQAPVQIPVLRLREAPE